LAEEVADQVEQPLRRRVLAGGVVGQPLAAIDGELDPSARIGERAHRHSSRMDVVTEPAQLIDQGVEPSQQRGGEQAEFLGDLDRHILYPQSSGVRFEQRILGSSDVDARQAEPLADLGHLLIGRPRTRRRPENQGIRGLLAVEFTHLSRGVLADGVMRLVGDQQADVGEVDAAPLDIVADDLWSRYDDRCCIPQPLAPLPVDGTVQSDH